MWENFCSQQALLVCFYISKVLENMGAFNAGIKEGDILMNYLYLPMSSPIMQKIGFLFCVERGVKLGGNPETRKKAFEFSKFFMRKTLIEK